MFVPQLRRCFEEDEEEDDDDNNTRSLQSSYSALVTVKAEHASFTRFTLSTGS